MMKCWTFNSGQFSSKVIKITEMKRSSTELFVPTWLRGCCKARWRATAIWTNFLSRVVIQNVHTPFYMSTHTRVQTLHIPQTSTTKSGTSNTGMTHEWSQQQGARMRQAKSWIHTGGSGGQAQSCPGISGQLVTSLTRADPDDTKTQRNVFSTCTPCGDNGGLR